MNKLKCAIDLLWIRPKQVGGIESVARNILDGFVSLDDEYEFWLLVSEDNAYSFQSYAADPRFHLEVCNVKSADVGKRIIWQNLHLGEIIRSLGLNKCFEPYYCKPVLGTQGIDFYTIIHDLQALHYAEYFSKAKVLWMKMSWKNTLRTSKTTVAISEFVRSDILMHYSVDPKRVVTIYDPITVDMNDVATAEVIKDKYGVEPDSFFFTVSSLLPHKNLTTLLDVMRLAKENVKALPQKLIISGVGGKSKQALLEKIETYGLKDNVLLTPFIENDERNALYKYCKVFLFPSVFEGFGMPPIEALKFGTPVVTTQKTSLPEVTLGKANYVNDPYNAAEWVEVIKTAGIEKNIDFSCYDAGLIAKKYLRLLRDEY